jgi:hypothetical protein
MIPADSILPHINETDPARLRELGWSDESLPVRAQVIETLRGWLAADRPDSAAQLTPEEIRPLVLLSETDTPAAAEAALLLALLQSGRRVVANEPADRE